MRREADKDTDLQLNEYVSLNHPKSFFLMAGAGSGKTRSLVSMLEYLRATWRRNLKNTGRKIAVITFTKAVSEEIEARISYDSSFHISTIHSFAWEMIKHFQQDIREYLITYYNDKLTELRNKKTTAKRAEEIEKFKERLNRAEKATRFNYSPETNVTGKGYLSHSEVVKIMTELLQNNHTFSKILVGKYPVLLIDECQDTDKRLLTSLIQIEANHNDFCLGLIGDMMQRVYNGGLEDLPIKVSHWGETPKKEMNWRCQKRIVDFINVLRKQTDDLQQYPNKDKNTGVLRTYIIQETSSDIERIRLENRIRANFKQMIDENEETDIMTLILEHKMAARRIEFSNMYLALDKDGTKNAIKDGTGKEMDCIKNFIIPFIHALQAPNEFELLRLFRKENIFEHHNSIQRIEELKKKIDHIRPKVYETLTLRKAIDFINELNITELPDAFLYPNEEDVKTENWQKAMDISLNEFEKYFNYKDEQSPYVTQQGSKGLEYDHVMVIMNDNEAGGRLFHFGKVYGTTEPSKTDSSNEKAGKDNAISRTKRLLYVAASRAKESLGLVIYSPDVDGTKEYFLESGLVRESEIVTEEYL